MQYIVCKNFQGKILDGYYYSVLVGALCEEKDNIIYHCGRCLFYKTSQNAYDYLARNDDGKGQQRFSLCQEIKAKLVALQEWYVEQVNEETSWLSESDREHYEIQTPNKVAMTFEKWESDENIKELINNDNINTFAFYNADIELLQQMLEMVEE